MNAIELNRHTTCMKIYSRGIVVSSSLFFPIRRRINKKKDEKIKSDDDYCRIGHTNEGESAVRLTRDRSDVPKLQRKKTYETGEALIHVVARLHALR